MEPFDILKKVNYQANITDKEAPQNAINSVIAKQEQDYY
jgi:hypothetical protein